MNRQHRTAVTRGGLTVRYRASPEPQLVDISLALADPYPALKAQGVIEALLVAANAGAAGGAILSPLAGGGRLVAGPTDPASDEGPLWRWQVELAGVCPRYWRHFCDDASLAGGGTVALAQLGIVGQLPLDDTPMSLRENELGRWFEGLDTWAERWPSPPFRVLDVAQPAGVSCRLRFSVDTTVDLLVQVEQLFDRWCLLVSPQYREDGFPGAMQLAPQIVRNRREIAAHHTFFKYAPGPPGDLLHNMLVRFHHDVAPIETVELGFG
ncbi:MAG: hypothetical protein KC731_27185 [Myxococcales bacterium]|nr:hypothetical protein [Myxococcales bacterium]